MKNFWTKKRIEKLTRLWEKGISAREIAEKIGDVSRNAVIGKANRLGLSKKHNKVKVESEVNKTTNISLLVPNMSGCKWPIGHPGDEDFYFCGKEVIPGKPYCNEHCLVAYRRKDNGNRMKKFFKLGASSD
jgi:GcrA cell cycle regulator